MPNCAQQICHTVERTFKILVFIYRNLHFMRRDLADKKYYALHSDHFIVGNAKFCFAPGDKFSPTGSIRMRGCRKIPKEREAIFFR